MVYVDKEVVAVTRQCEVCQKFNAESPSLKLAERVIQIIDQFIPSLCLEIITMPLVQRRDGEWDCFCCVLTD